MSPPTRREVYVEILVKPNKFRPIPSRVKPIKDEPDPVKRETTLIPKEEEPEPVINVPVTVSPSDHKPLKAKKEKKEEDEIKSNLKFVKPEPEDIKINLKFDIDRALPPTFDIPKEAQSILHASASREYFSKVYGGNTQDTCPRIRRSKWEEHKITFMFINLNFHPNASAAPGAGGLFFTTPGEIDDSKEGTTVYHAIERMAANFWKYIGQYKMKPQPQLTADEWNAQRETVKSTWIQGMMRMQWGNSTKAYAVLGKQLGRRPTEKEVDDLIDEVPEDHKFPEVDAALLREAFSEGWVYLNVYALECVGYDVAFQEKVSRDAPGMQDEFDNKARVKKEEADEKKALAALSTPKKKSKARPVKPPTPKTPKKRKRDERDAAEEVGQWTYTPRGTRSRPNEEYEILE